MEKPILKATANLKIDDGKTTFERVGLKLKTKEGYSLAVEKGAKKDFNVKFEIEL